MINATSLEGLSAEDLDRLRTKAKSVDAIVVCVGESTYVEKPGDINDLSLAQGQTDYVKFLSTLGRPIILVIIAGRPRLLNGSAELSSAIIQMSNPGPMGGK